MNRGRVASDLGRAFRLTVRVERPGTDPNAVSFWRCDPASGGGLADHGIHYLALARILHPQLTAIAATRTHDPLGRERATATVQVGSGILSLDVNYGAASRRNIVELRTGEGWTRWEDNVLTSGSTSDGVSRLTVPSLSDRRHVNALYLKLYQEVVSHRTATRGEVHQPWPGSGPEDSAAPTVEKSIIAAPSAV